MESNILVIRDWNWKIRINVIESSRERNREKRVAFIALFRFCCRGKKKEDEERRKKPIVIFSNFPNWTQCTNARVKGVSRLFGKRGSNSGKANRTKRRSPSLPLSLVFFRGMDKLDVETIGNRARWWNERRGRVGLTRASCTRDIIFASCDRKSGKWIFSLNEIVWRASATSV